MADRPDSDIELHQLQLRFAAARVSDERAVQRLMHSIDACGQLVACIAVREGAGEEAAPLVLIDGYRRVAALHRLGRDTARVQCAGGTLAEALAQLLACAQSRSLAAIEQALLLRELIDGQHLSQREAARQCGRDASWVQRRLLLLQALPEGVLEAVRGGSVSGWAACACSRRWRAPTPNTRSACWSACAAKHCPRVICTCGSATTSARSGASASTWSSTRGCSSTACASVSRTAQPCD